MGNQTKKILNTFSWWIIEIIFFGMLIFLFTHEGYFLIGEQMLPILSAIFVLSGLTTPFLIWFEVFDFFWGFFD